MESSQKCLEHARSPKKWSMFRKLLVTINLVLLIAQWDLFANLVSHHPIVIVVLSILEETRPTIMASKNCHVKRSVTVSVGTVPRSGQTYAWT